VLPQAFEAEHFPDPNRMRETIGVWTLGIYPTCIKWAMALFDVVESIAVSRATMCSGGGLAALTRLQVGPGRRTDGQAPCEAAALALPASRCTACCERRPTQATFFLERGFGIDSKKHT
jgi:hypothetical protein